MRMLRDRLDAALGPGHAEVNASTGSILVRYDRHCHASADMLAILRDVGMVVETAMALTVWVA